MSSILAANASAKKDTASDRPASVSGDQTDITTGDQTDITLSGAAPSPDNDVEKAPDSALADHLDWDGPDDPDNPMNWPDSKRHAQVILVALLVLLINLASTMFAPAASQLMIEFGFSSEIVASLTVSIFLLGFAIGPLLWAPLSEIYGRLVIYAVSTVVFLAFVIGSAFATNVGSFMAFRVLSGIGGGASLAIFGGTLADVIPPARRGLWTSLFALGILLGPVTGPIMGGFIGEEAGWRWVFRVLAIASGAILIVGALFMHETYGPVILHRREHRRRQQNPDKYPALPTVSVWTKLRGTILRPLQLIVYSPIVLLIATYVSFYFGVIFLLFTTFGTVFRKQYGWSIGISGLSYLGLGVGCLFGVISMALTSDRMMKQLAAKTGESRPEHRLLLMVLGSPSLPIGMFWYGWAADKQTHWIVPIIGTSFIGVGFILTLMPSMVYLVDCFGKNAAASALAAHTLFRCLVGAFLPLAGPAMYSSLGLGWGNSLLAFIAIGLMPIPLVFYVYGHRIRAKTKITF